MHWPVGDQARSVFSSWPSCAVTRIPFSNGILSVTTCESEPRLSEVPPFYPLPLLAQVRARTAGSPGRSAARPRTMQRIRSRTTAVEPRHTNTPNLWTEGSRRQFSCRRARSAIGCLLGRRVLTPSACPLLLADPASITCWLRSLRSGNGHGVRRTH